MVVVGVGRTSNAFRQLSRVRPVAAVVMAVTVLSAVDPLFGALPPESLSCVTSGETGRVQPKMVAIGNSVPCVAVYLRRVVPVCSGFGGELRKAGSGP